MTLVIHGATILDGITEMPLKDRAIAIDGDRIRSIVPVSELDRSLSSCERLDATGKFVIPGLLNANVHLLMDVRAENLLRYEGRFEALIEEAAQIALRSGVTTVFDTWGPRRALASVRDRIVRGEVPGSRIFCGGNIVGLDGPFSADFDFFNSKGAVSSAFARRMNALWVENVGRHLMWLTPEQVGSEVRKYIAGGINFVKYASNDHVPGAFLAFSPRAQEQIVARAHAAALTAQAHTMSVEGLRIAIEAGCDLIQHANLTGPVPIPDETLKMFEARGISAVVFPQTERRLRSLMTADAYKEYRGEAEWLVSDQNVSRLIASPTRLLLGTDGALMPAAAHDNSVVATGWNTSDTGSLFDLATGHFYWLEAMEEKQCSPFRLLQAATHNVAAAYGMAKDLGSIRPGQYADMVILDKDPYLQAKNFCSIYAVIKNGRVVNRDELPLNPLLTARSEAGEPEEAAYVPFISSLPYPSCLTCRPRQIDDRSLSRKQ